MNQSKTTPQTPPVWHVCLALFAAAILLSMHSVCQGQKLTKAVTPNYKQMEKYSSSFLSKFYGDTSVRANWINESDIFWYRYQTSEGTFYYLVKPAEKSKNLIFDNADMAAQLSLLSHKSIDPHLIPNLDLKFNETLTEATFSYDGKDFKFYLTTKKLEFIGLTPKEEDEPGRRQRAQRGQRGGRAIRERRSGQEEEEESKWPEWVTFSPDKSHVVYAQDYNLFVIKVEDLETFDPNNTEGVQLTTEGVQGFQFGPGSDSTDKAERDKRRKARINWINETDKFYLTRRDQRQPRGQLFVVNSIADPKPTLRTYGYSFPGDFTGEDSRLWIFDADKMTGEKLENPFHGPSFSGFHVNEKHFHFIRTSRDYKHVQLCSLDVDTYQVKILIDDHVEPYIMRVHGHSIDIDYYDDSNEFTWWSDRDGWSHYYLYDQDGTLKNQITKGPYSVTRVTKTDIEKRVMYFTANGGIDGENPYFTHNYRVNLDGSSLVLLNPGAASHSISLSPSANYLVDNWSRADQAPRSVLNDGMGNKIMDLEETDLTRLLSTGWKPPEIFKVKAADGVTDLWGVMYRPVDFDETKQYAVIDYVYPGPQQEGPRFTFSPASSNQTIANLGFIAMSVGNRGGSPNRSAYYHSYGYKNARDYGLADQKFAIEQLGVMYPQVDVDRVGIHGHSGGGFMSTAAVLVYPDFFDVAVSSAGNHDNNIYNRTWGEYNYGVEAQEVKVEEEETEERTITERIDRAPTISPEEQIKIEWVTEIASNPEVADNLKGHLLLAHGDMDTNVHPANTIRVVNALIKAGKRFDMIIFPGKAHSFGDMGAYFNRMKYDYFCEHLLGDSNKGVQIFENDPRFIKDK